jgi:hypothetical protein
MDDCEFSSPVCFLDFDHVQAQPVDQKPTSSRLPPREQKDGAAVCESHNAKERGEDVSCEEKDVSSKYDPA